jgi:hypothetical protein
MGEDGSLMFCESACEVSVIAPETVELGLGMLVSLLTDSRHLVM